MGHCRSKRSRTIDKGSTARHGDRVTEWAALPSTPRVADHSTSLNGPAIGLSRRRNRGVTEACEHCIDLATERGRPVARIPLVDPSVLDINPKAAAILETVQEQFGRDFDVISALANPDAMEAFLGLQAEVYTSKRLTSAQTEIAYYTAAVADSGHY